MLLIALGFRINKPVPFLSDTIQSLPGLCELTGVTEKKGAGINQLKGAEEQ